MAPCTTPPLSKRDAERVLRLVRVHSADMRDADILREASFGVQWIKRKTATIQSPSQRKDALLTVAKNFQELIESIEDLPEATQWELDPKALRRTEKRTPYRAGGPDIEVERWPGTLQQLHDRTIALADKIKVGGSDSRSNAAGKRAAADFARHMLQTFGSRPTLTRGGRYLKLATLIFELATGKLAGDMTPACKRQREKTSEGIFDEWELTSD
jgi:hypothetical protein